MAQDRDPPSVASWVAAYFIFLAWGTSLAYGMATGDYEAIQLVSPMMAAAVTFLFGLKIVGKGRSDG